MHIHAIELYAVFDSRGFPAVEALVTVEKKGQRAQGRAAAPSGASTGSFEAYEKRDGLSAFGGKGVAGVCAYAQQHLVPALIGKEGVDVCLLATEPSPNKAHFGANVLLSISLAAQIAMARLEEKPLFKFLRQIFFPEKGTIYTLPTPMMNIINGGLHADNGLDIQEFMIVPHGFDSFREKFSAGVEVFHQLKKILKQRHLSTSVGDEGGFAPHISCAFEVLDTLMQAIEVAGYRPGEQISLALDVAANEFYHQTFYKFMGKNHTAAHMVDFYTVLYEKYPLLSIEDGLTEEDWDGWKLLTQKLGKKCMLVGDDLFTTNQTRLQKGIETQTANSILIKPNQIGTLLETCRVIQMAECSSYAWVISHRSGETEDTTIADLSVASNAPYIKAGAPSRGERIAKYNQLLRIEQMLQKKN